MKAGQIVYLRKTDSGSYFPYETKNLTDLPHGTRVFAAKIIAEQIIEHVVSLKDVK